MIEQNFKNLVQMSLLDKPHREYQQQQLIITNSFKQCLGDKSYPVIEKKNIYLLISQITSKFKPVYPEKGWLLIWNGLVMFVILYYLFEIGLLMGYGEPVWEDSQYFLDILNYTFILVLIFDCFLNTIKSYYFHGKLITNHSLIIKRYLKLQFYIDILAIVSVSIPFFSTIYELNLVKILFLMKIYTLSQIDQSFIKIAEESIYFYRFYAISRLVLMLILASHYFGIFFYMIDYWIYENNYYGPNTPNLCWIYNSPAYPQLVLQPWYIQYIYTLYFGVGGMTTVAFVNVSSLNPLQTLYMVFALVAFILGFSYIFSEIIRVLISVQAAKFEHSNNLLIISNLMKNHHVSKKIQTTVKSYFEKIWKEQMYRNREIQKQLIQKLPHKIRNQLFSKMYKSFFQASGLFPKGSNLVVESPFIVCLASEIQEQRLIEGHIIYKQGEEYDPQNFNNHCFYFIKELKRKMKPSIQIGVMDIQIQILSEGQFGKQGFISGKKRSHWARVLQSVLVYKLARKKFLKNLYLATQIEEENLFIINERVQTEKCYICSQEGHSFESCGLVTYQVNKFGLIEHYSSLLIPKTYEQQKQKATLIRNRKSFNSLKLYKTISSLKLEINSQYFLSRRNRYYKGLFIQKNYSLKKNFDFYKNFHIVNAASLVGLSQFEMKLKQAKFQFIFIRPLGEMKIYKRQILEDKSQNETAPIQYSDSEPENQSLSLEKYLGEVQSYLNCLYAEVKENCQQFEADIAKQFKLYKLKFNIKSLIEDYNKKLQKQKNEGKKRAGDREVPETDSKLILHQSQRSEYQQNLYI